MASNKKKDRYGRLPLVVADELTPLFADKPYEFDEITHIFLVAGFSVMQSNVTLKIIPIDAQLLVLP